MTPTEVMRISQLEKRVRQLTMLAVIAFIGVAILGVSGWRNQSEPQVLRAQALIIVDENGTERIVLGAPIPEPESRRIAPVTGLAINDTAGAERFGVGVFDNGQLVMGFDAPPGAGDPRNRERITISVGSSGGAELRFLNRQTRVVAHMSLFQDDNVYLFFTDYQPDKTIVHRIGATGDTIVVHDK